MGLEQYLSVKVYLQKGSKINVNGYKNLTKDLIELNQENIFGFCNINVSFGYFRKFNALHKKILDLTGQDEDMYYHYIGEEDVKQLYEDACKVIEILKDKKLNKEDIFILTKEEKFTIKDLFDTQEGFFFGSTEFDKYYLQDLLKLKELLEKYKEFAKKYSCDLIYEASW